MVSSTRAKSSRSTRLDSPLRSVTWFWALAAMPVAFMGVLFQNYFFIYATDVLLLAPAAVGILVAAARIYDGVSDLYVAAYSDRSRSRFGRRRPLILVGGLGLIFYGGLWLPPEQLSASVTIVWLGLMLLVFETASTLLIVPMLALGLEAGATAVKRSRFQVIGLVTGLPFAIGANLVMQQAIDSPDARDAIAPFVIAAGVVMAIASTALGTQLKELPRRPETADRHIIPMLRDVLKIGYHRQLIAVQLAETVGFTSLAFSVPYVLTYIIDRPDGIAMVFIIYLVISVLTQPVWVTVIPRLGMPRIWRIGLVGWLLVFTLTPIAAYSGIEAYFGLALLAGISGGASTVVYAMLGDLADYDARKSGHERQAVYVTIYRLINKLGGALVALLLGLGLQASGFVPEMEQSRAVKLAILASACAVPFIGVALGLAILRRYDLYDREGLSDGRGLPSLEIAATT